MYKLRKSLILIAASAAMTALTLQTAQAALLTTSGTWSNVTPAAVNNLTGVGTNTISWGTPLTFFGQSQYNYTGVSNQLLALPTTLGGMVTFNMGTFTHNNRTISGAVANPTITGATLNIPFTLVNGSLAGGTLLFNFAHFETPNDATPCGAGGSIPCPDEVSIAGSSPDQFFSAMDMNFQFEIFGFQRGGVTNPTFLTLENTSNTANLIGKITKLAVAVPEPSTMALFGIGLFGLGFMARRRRKTA